MVYTTWYLLVGAVFILMALSGTVLRRLPISPSMLYLGAGVLIGPQALDLVAFDPTEEAAIVERITEVAVMLMVGAMVSTVAIPTAAFWFVPLLLLVIRPVAAGIGTIGSETTAQQRAFIAWFGIRGIGSVYYLTYAIEQGVGEGTANVLTGITLAAVAASVIVHGISVTPLMRRYAQGLAERDSPPVG